MASKLLSPVCNEQKFDNIGNPLSGGTTSIYYQNTLTLASIYANSTGGALTNPITLDSAGRISNGQIYLDLNFGYDIVVKQGTTTLESYSGIIGILPNSNAISSSPQNAQFTATTVTNTFSLTFTGDISTFTAVVNGISLNPFTDFIISGYSIVLSSNLNIGDVLVVHSTGQIGLSIIAPNNISGSINLTSTTNSSWNVTFVTPEVDNNYKIFAQVNTNSLSSVWIPSILVNTKTISGFNIRLSSFPFDTNFKIDWFMIR
jgi:hypothetical protein